MKRIPVLKGKNKYNVFLENGGFEHLPGFISSLGLNPNILFVIDENVLRYHSSKINSVMEKAGGNSHIYLIPPGEKNKSFKTYDHILSYMTEKNYGRDTLIAAIGGGVTGDIAGFAASTYIRGVQIVHIPTTLLALIDSSIGGKTGVNFAGKKNIIGTFYQPALVLSDPAFLETLPHDELISGAGELIKYAFLSDRNSYNMINDAYDSIISRDLKETEKVIELCIRLKSEIVTADEHESGLRKILNLGHTFAHAYESYLDFGVKHGNAVAAGIISSLLLSYKKGVINQSALKYYLKLPSKIGSIKIPLSEISEIINLMRSDKKNKEGEIRFVLVKDIGEILIDIPASQSEIMFAVRNSFNPKL
jgi:3-dehydroquinate synthase